MLFARLATEGVEIGVRERVIAGRIAAEIAIEQQTKLTPERWAFLLRARLTPALAKSPEDVARVRRAFLDLFPQQDPIRFRGPIPVPIPVLPDSNKRQRFRIATLAALIALTLAGIVIARLIWSPSSVVEPPKLPISTGPSQQQPTQPPISALGYHSTLGNPSGRNKKPRAVRGFFCGHGVVTGLVFTADGWPEAGQHSWNSRKAS